MLNDTLNQRKYIFSIMENRKYENIGIIYHAPKFTHTNSNLTYSFYNTVNLKMVDLTRFTILLYFVFYYGKSCINIYIVSILVCILTVQYNIYYNNNVNVFYFFVLTIDIIF